MAFPPVRPPESSPDETPQQTPEAGASSIPTVAREPVETDAPEAYETGWVPNGAPIDTAEPQPWTEEDQQRLEELNLRKRRRARRLGMELVQTLVLATMIFFAVRTVAQNFKVEGSSMEPGLHDGQYLLVNKMVYYQLDMTTIAKFLPFIHVGDNPNQYLFHGPRRGDVVVFRYPADPKRDFIKRVIGVPGDTVEILHGQLTVNGKPVKEDYLNSGTYDMTTEKKTVPPGQYFVLGDNRNNSSDSRAWGYVPADNIIGQAMFSYWPLSNVGGAGNRQLSLGIIDIPVPAFALPF